MTEAEQITAASRSNLALAFIALPKARRTDISIFYAFCRLVDDIADGTGSREEKAQALALWRTALDAPVPDEPVLAGPVRALIARYELPREYFREIIQGVEMDLDPVEYPAWEDLRVYCYRVASVVGLVSVRIFGARDPAADDYAVNLGLALQLTNILRDVGQDFGNGGRIYLPRDDMDRFGVSQSDLAGGRRSAGFLALMDFEAKRAQQFYAASVLPPSDRRVLVAAEIMRAVYARLLRKMQRDRWRVFDRRYRLGKATKLALVLGGWIRSRFG